MTATLILAVCREELAVKVAALEERLDEMRAEHGQAATYKQVRPCFDPVLSILHVMVQSA